MLRASSPSQAFCLPLRSVQGHCKANDGEIKPYFLFSACQHQLESAIVFNESVLSVCTQNKKQTWASGGRGEKLSDSLGHAQKCLFKTLSQPFHLLDSTSFLGQE